MKPIENKYYPAYAWRHFVSYKDVMLDKPCDTYEEAKEKAISMLCDDDNCGVYLFHCNHWWEFVPDWDVDTFVFNKVD